MRLIADRSDEWRRFYDLEAAKLPPCMRLIITGRGNVGWNEKSG